ncbi:tetratricopeptide repeat protein [Streptomyces mangrovisoli]|uniref:tetratricopeptide repeat protein n=1 Tax=Streptomyces mangrovisoli TaxID=1428628 RepID=UPI00142D3981|nr:tetratricopeptide repeat protein [Streptomyces mangrovisoli]
MSALVLVPVAASVTQVVTTVVTAHFDWRLFAILVVLSATPAVGALVEGRSPQRHSGEDRTSGRSGRDLGSGLPPPVGTRVFTGRTEPLRRLRSCEAREGNLGPLIIAITGLGGTGKTELALRAVRELAVDYPDAQLWLEMRTYAAAESRMSMEQALRLLLNALGVSPDPHLTGVAALSRTWRSATENKKLLVVLDDVDQVDQVQPLLPAATSAIALTSRHPLPGLDPDIAVVLDTLTQDEACTLASRILERAGSPDADTARMIAAAFRLPLTVRQVADLKAANPGVDLTDLLTGDDQAVPDVTAGDQLLRSLPTDARLVLRRAAYYPGSLISPEVAAVMSGKPVRSVRPVLAHLYQRGLLLPDRRTGYRIHDLVRTAAQNTVSPRDRAREQAACDERLFHYVHLATSFATRALYCAEDVAMPDESDVHRPHVPAPRFASNVAAAAWLDEQHTDLLAVARRCVAQRSPRAWKLIYQLEYYQRIRGFYDEIVELHIQVLRQTEESGDLLGQAGMHQNLGLVDMRTGNYPAARGRFHQALALYAAAGNPTGQAEIHHEMHHIDCWLGNLPSAHAHGEAELRFAQDGGTLIDLAAAHADLGWVERLEGNHDSAHRHLTASLRLYEQTGQPRGTATAHRHLGLLATARGDAPAARTHFDQAMTRYLELGDILNQAETHIGLATLQRRPGGNLRSRCLSESGGCISAGQG